MVNAIIANFEKDKLLSYIKLHKKDILNSDFDSLFDPQSDAPNIYLWRVKLSYLLLDIGVNPFEYITKIPEHMICLDYNFDTDEDIFIVPDNITEIQSDCGLFGHFYLSVNVLNVEVLGRCKLAQNSIKLYEGHEYTLTLSDGCKLDKGAIWVYYSCDTSNGHFTLRCYKSAVSHPDLSVIDWPEFSGKNIDKFIEEFVTIEFLD